jgi:hypothetical protein
LHIWERGGTFTGFFWERLKEKAHLEDQDVDGRMGSKRTLARLVGGVKWIHFIQDRGRWQAVGNAAINLQDLASRS